MSSKNLPPWQNVLDSLTKKSQEWDLFSGVDRRNETEIVRAFLKKDSLRSYLNEWIDLCLSNGSKKSVAESVVLRSKGNEAFKKHFDSTSLMLYTDCIRYAPYGSPEHALGLANRSAVLYHMKKFRDCVKDAEKALTLPYPERLKYKLLLRVARCYLNLKDCKNCEAFLQLSQTHISQNVSGNGMEEFNSIKGELNILQKREYEEPEKETLQDGVPSLLNGPSSCFPFASSALELRYSESKGRYVVTNQDIRQGDVLFVEKPYAFVVLPDQFKLHCHHCSRTLVAPMPCRSCVDVLFCDEVCEVESCASYHRWECGAIDLMSAVGVAHLGLRVVLLTGLPDKVLDRSHAASHLINSSKGSFGNLEDPYSTVYSLLPHIEDMSLDDLFQYAATAELLTLFLMNKTDYFTEEDKLAGSESEAIGQVGALLLRHIAQLVCNAHAITKLDSDRNSAIISVDHYNTVVPESQQRIATAIYPSASMMNHSCDPNIINSFFNELLVVKACRNISKGEEVFNCYGPHFQRMGTAERQAALQAQYFFHCQCSACTSSPGETFDPVQERLWALRCSSCSGPLINEAPGREPAGSKVALSDLSNSHFMVCDTCGSHQPISDLVRDSFSALSLFKEGCQLMNDGHMQDALNSLKRCQQLQERALYKSNKDLTATYDMLAKCYATLGHYKKSENYLEIMLPAVEEQYGANSIEIANELQKLSDVMMCHIRTMETTPSRDMLDKASNVVERALSITSLHYGKWNQGWQDLDKKRQELKLMNEMASVQSAMNHQMKF